MRILMYPVRNIRVPHGGLALFLILALVLVVLSGCQDRRASRRTEAATTPTQAQEATQRVATPTTGTSREEMKMGVNRIAYIGSDGNIFTINPDGTDSRRLTDTDVRVGPAGHIMAQGVESQALYAWPTWSPDSKKLAASRITVQRDTVFFTLEAIDATSGSVTRIFDNEPNTLPVAEGSPHYIYWSPDSEHLTFIASTPRELSLFFSTPGQGQSLSRVLGQGPLYFSWANDGSTLLIHRGEELLVVPVASDGPRPPKSVGTASLGFRAPALSPDATRMVYAAEDDGGDAIFLADTEGPLSAGKSILDVGPFSAFLWSPTRDEIAVADTSSTTTSIYERLTITGGNGSSNEPLVTETFIAFFWSPDGEKIIYVAFDLERRTFTWKYVDRTSGPPKSLVEFVPSSEFLTLISFFDQYAYSNSVWSPDSSQIVFSGTVGGGAQGSNGASPEEDTVYVIDVKENSTPRAIASSAFAVWSWR